MTAYLTAVCVKLVNKSLIKIVGGSNVATVAYYITRYFESTAAHRAISGSTELNLKLKYEIPGMFFVCCVIIKN